MAVANWAHKCLFFSLMISSCARAVTYDTVDDLPSLEYDFIIVGGGTAGNVIANRLTEDPSTSVLVLEAGGSNENVLNAMVPLYCPRLSPRTPWDWNSTTVPQVHANNRTIGYPRGFILGGSSSINWMVYTRGSAEDWNRYADLTGDQGWAWVNMQSYFRRNEQFVLPAITDGRNMSAAFDPSIHSFTGMNYVSLPYPMPIDSRAVEATQQLPDEFRYNTDYNSGIQYGIGWTQFTIGGGKRSSSATSYLGPQFLNRRRNLNVLLHAHVARLIQTGSYQGQPIIRQVEFKDGELVRVAAKKEIILSAGALGSPHILLNSGIGDSEELSALGIKPILNLPSVGRNLSDHSMIRNFWPANATTTFEHFTRNATLQAEALDEWTQHKTGLLTAGVSSHLGWIRVPEESKVFHNAVDYAAGPNTGHFELLVTNGNPEWPLRPTSENLTTLGIYTAVLNPASRGTVTINSTDPFAPPLIDPNYLAAEPDISVMREAIRSARRFAAAPAWKDYIIGPPLVQAETDEELNEYIRDNVVSVLHPSGTAGMSPKGATWGVVDPDLKVKRVVGLRIVDASVLPLIPAGHTQAPTYAVAERAADLIKQSWINAFRVRVQQT